MLNPALFRQLEDFGLTDQHLTQLLAMCAREGTGRVTWHIDPSGVAKVEVTLFATRRDSTGMRNLTHLLQKEHS